MPEYSKLKVVDLKAELKSRGLAQTGLKQALIERLEEADASTGDSQDAANKGGNEDIPANDAQTEPAAKTQQDVPQASKTPVSDTSKPQILDPPQRDVSDNTSSASAQPPEAIDDSKKRKRRSQTPPPSAVESAKKVKQTDAVADGVILKEDLTSSTPGVGDKGLATQDEEPKTAPEAFEAKEKSEVLLKQSDGSADAVMDDKGDEAPVIPSQPVVDSIPAVEENDKEATSPVQPSSDAPIGKDHTSDQQGSFESLASVRQPPGSKDTRFKDLFGQQDSLGGSQPLKNQSRTLGGPFDEMDTKEERQVAPAIHVATPALYIRDFMRPLQPSALQRHLVSLATPSTSSPKEEILKDFHLDSVRTHCFALFTSIAAASRVRSALHHQVWPDERTRKPLWVDFVPEDKIAAWIKVEKDSSSGASGRSISGPRWEVVYVDGNDSDSDSNVIEAIHQEVGAPPHGRIVSGAGRGVQGAPSGPRGDPDSTMRDADYDQSRRRGREGAPLSRPEGSGFVALDSLFKSTTTKPKLYFLPVPPDLSRRRMDRLAGHVLNPGPRGRLARGRDELKRYTFEDGDVIVDRGVELNHNARGGYRGRGGGGSGPRRGGYRDTGYRGGPDRRY